MAMAKKRSKNPFRIESNWINIESIHWLVWIDSITRHHGHRNRCFWLSLDDGAQNTFSWLSVAKCFPSLSLVLIVWRVCIWILVINGLGTAYASMKYDERKWISSRKEFCLLFLCCCRRCVWLCVLRYNRVDLRRILHSTKLKRICFAFGFDVFYWQSRWLLSSHLPMCVRCLHRVLRWSHWMSYDDCSRHINYISAIDTTANRIVLIDWTGQWTHLAWDECVIVSLSQTNHWRIGTQGEKDR